MREIVNDAGCRYDGEEQDRENFLRHFHSPESWTGPYRLPAYLQSNSCHTVPVYDNSFNAGERPFTGCGF